MRRSTRSLIRCVRRRTKSGRSSDLMPSNWRARLSLSAPRNPANAANSWAGKISPRNEVLRNLKLYFRFLNSGTRGNLPSTTQGNCWGNRTTQFRSPQGESMKTAYLDIETSYEGTFTDQRLFKDSKNHRITVIGIRVMDGERDAFVQLIGNDVTRANLMLVLNGVERLVTYNGRSVRDKVKGFVGFDFPVIAAQLGVVLDRS